MDNKTKKLSRKEVKTQLNKIIEEFQKKSFKTLLNKVNAKNKLKSKSKETDSLQETIDYLRVCVKYSLFDLEATRRENKSLKKLLDQE